MLTAQYHQLYELRCKTGLQKGKKFLVSSKVSGNRVAMLEKKQTVLAMRAYSQVKGSKLVTEIIPPLTERGGAQDRAKQTVDC